jgi:integrase
MNTVEPIRDIKKIAAIKNMLKAKKNPRDFLLFTMGINSALRISDLLKLQIGDVLDKRGDIREHLYLRVKKTGKELTPKINKSMREALEFYFSKLGPIDYDAPLFQSTRSEQPLDRVRAWTIINQWCEAVGLDSGRHGTHTLRKTWGFHARKMGIDIEIIREKLGQRNTGVTRRYIGLTQEEVNDVEEKVCL